MSKKMALIATKGTLDMAYPPFIPGSTAAALGWDRDRANRVCRLSTIWTCIIVT